MPTLPGRAVEAVEALAAYILTQDATAAIRWTVDDGNPVDVLPAEEWTSPTRNVYLITLLNLNTDGGTSREMGKGANKRKQVGELIIRSNLWERTEADLGRAQAVQALTIQNWVEELDNGGKHRNSRQWWIDHSGWEGIRDESGQAPHPGVRVSCELHVNQ